MAKESISGVRRDGLTIIYNPPLPEFDMFILHGLKGSPTTTFQCASSGFYWPQDLPTWLPKARIGMFGYVADLSNGTKNLMGIQQHAESLLLHLRNNRLEQQSERPIVFIGHSFGGLIIKQALILSSNNTVYCNIAPSTKLIVFLGVPHYGSQLVEKNRATLALTIGKVVNYSVPPKIMTALQPDADETYIINTQFMRIKGSTSIVNFYEQKPQNLLVGDVAVTRNSAIFDTETAENVPVARNHQDLVRFGSVDDEFYYTLRQTLQRKVREFMSATKEIEGYEKFKQARKSLLNILRDPSSQLTQDQIRSPHPNTLQWLWAHDSEFFKWITHGHGLFAITGKPGSGKSVLMNDMNDTIKRNFGNTFPITITHFFNSRGNSNEKTIVGFLRSILFQLIQADARYFHGLEQDLAPLWKQKLCDEDFEFSLTNQLPRSSFKTQVLEQMFLNAIKDMPREEKILILVDGLDECEDGLKELNTITNLLDDIVGSHGSGLVMICFSCRNLASYNFKHLCGTLNLQESNGRDIIKFIDDYWKLMSSIKDYDKEMTSVRLLIVSQADGVFLWVRLILERIQKALATGATISEIETIIDTPNQLYGLFSTLIDRIEPAFIEESRTMFSIILAAQRPLSLGEFRYVLALQNSNYKTQEELNKSSSFIKSDEIMKRRILSRCGDLVEVKVASDSSQIEGSEMGKNSIQFIHQSAKDFFVQPHSISIAIPDPETLVRCGHMALNHACANYLSQTDIRNLARRPDWSYNDRKGFGYYSKPFLDYALRNWVSHIRHVETTGTINSDIASPLLSDPSNFETCRLLHNRFYPKDILEQDYEASRFAVWNNLPLSLRWLCSHHLIEINKMDPNYGSYLHLAAERNNTEIIRVLLENSANINAQMLNKNPLDVACENGHLESARLLFESGAEIIYCRPQIDDPLVVAARLGNEELVELILNYIGEEYANLWYCDLVISRLRFRETSSVQLSLKEMSNHHYNTQRKDARQEKAVQMICDRLGFESELGSQSSSSWILISNAGRNEDYLRKDLDRLCEVGSLDSVRTLIESLPLMETLPEWICAPSGRLHRTLVHWAVINPCDSVLSYLLELGLRPDFQDCNGDTPLHLAAIGLKEIHINILLRYNADKTITSNDGFRAFHYALHLLSSHSMHLIKKLTVDLSDINLPTLSGIYPIRLVSEEGAFTTLKWLLDQGAEADVQDEFGRTIFHFAAHSSSPASVEILEYLINQGHDVKVRDLAGRTPLHIVLYEGKIKHDTDDLDIALENAKCLVQNGADVNAQDHEGNTPLHLAVWRNHKDIVRLLLRAGAQTSKTDNMGFTPIEMAPDDEMREIIELSGLNI
ncbi:hypothetical protein F4805DRAFT_432715 [Annulohypoxylon moriforme]|nr:hypothetical protein F4805DRAFT_432715 [Annulohypoxylon moriforme]